MGEETSVNALASKVHTGYPALEGKTLRKGKGPLSGPFQGMHFLEKFSLDTSSTNGIPCRFFIP